MLIPAVHYTVLKRYAVEGSPTYDVAIVQFRRFRHPRELRSEGATVADHG